MLEFITIVILVLILAKMIEPFFEDEHQARLRVQKKLLKKSKRWQK